MEATVQRIALVGILGMVALTTAADAQLREVRRDRRHLFGFGFSVTNPVGEFDRFVGLGGGANIYGVFNFNRRGTIGVRLDGSVVTYGHDRVQRPLSPTIQRVLVDVTTNNYITSFGLGPQITFGEGAVRPYVYGTAGFSYFATVSSAGGTADGGAFASHTNFDDVTFALTGAGGVRFRFADGKYPVSLDLSAHTTRNGIAEYVRDNGIQESADGTVTFTPVRSEANLVGFRVGVAIGI